MNISRFYIIIFLFWSYWLIPSAHITQHSLNLDRHMLPVNKPIDLYKLLNEITTFKKNYEEIINKSFPGTTGVQQRKKPKDYLDELIKEIDQELSIIANKIKQENNLSQDVSKIIGSYFMTNEIEQKIIKFIEIYNLILKAIQGFIPEVVAVISNTPERLIKSRLEGN